MKTQLIHLISWIRTRPIFRTWFKRLDSISWKEWETLLELQSRQTSKWRICQLSEFLQNRWDTRTNNSTYHHQRMAKVNFIQEKAHLHWVWPSHQNQESTIRLSHRRLRKILLKMLISLLIYANSSPELSVSLSHPLLITSLTRIHQLFDLCISIFSRIKDTIHWLLMDVVWWWNHI